MRLQHIGIDELLDAPRSSWPTVSLYLDVDGERHPRQGDYLTHLDALLRQAREQAEGFARDHRNGVEEACEAISSWVRTELDRDTERGLALFARGGDPLGLVALGVPLPNEVHVASRPRLARLADTITDARHLGMVVIQRDQARFIDYWMGYAWEAERITSDVPGWHSQGGWSQRRFQAHIAHKVLHHKKDAAEALRRLHGERHLDALLIAGPHAEAKEFVDQLSHNLQQLVTGEPLRVDPDAHPSAYREHFAEVERRMVDEVRERNLQRLEEAWGTGTREPVAAITTGEVLDAVNARRVDVLFTAEGVASPGYRGGEALTLDEAGAREMGQPIEPVDDVIAEAAEDVVRSGADLELIDPDRVPGGPPMAALLRY